MVSDLLPLLSFICCSLAAIVLAPLAGRYLFRKRVARDVTTLLSTTMSSVGPQQLADGRDFLPEPVRRYLRFAIEDGAPATRTVRLENGGTFRPIDDGHHRIRKVDPKGVTTTVTGTGTKGFPATALRRPKCSCGDPAALRWTRRETCTSWAPRGAIRMRTASSLLPLGLTAYNGPIARSIVHNKILLSFVDYYRLVRADTAGCIPDVRYRAV